MLFCLSDALQKDLKEALEIALWDQFSKGSINLEVHMEHPFS